MGAWGGAGTGETPERGTIVGLVALGGLVGERRLHQLLALHGEDVAVEGLVLAWGLAEGLAVSGYLLLGECRHIGASSREFLTVSDLFLGGRYGDLTD